MFLAWPEGYPAFVVEIEGSECDSAEDTDATAHCTARQQSRGGCLFASLWQRLIVWLRLSTVLF